MKLPIFTTFANNEINRAYEIIPKKYHKYLECDWLIGKDPIKFGLHNFTDTSDGRTYRNTAHVAYPHHHRKLYYLPSVVVLPEPDTVDVVVHELAHVIHFNINFDGPKEGIVPVSWYAKTNWYEAFAEAFTSLVIPGYANPIDPNTRLFFEYL